MEQPDGQKHLYNDERRKEIRKSLVRAMDDILKNAGFKRKSSTWRKEGSDVVLVVNLQKYSYSFLYFLNLGVFIKEMDPAMKEPDEVYCHFRERFEFTIAKERVDQGKLKEFLNFEDPSCTPEQKIADFTTVLGNKVLPFLDSLDSIEKIVQSNIKGLSLPAREFLKKYKL